MTLTDHTTDPDSVTAGPTHPNPYPYYARLARESSLQRDSSLGCWVAASISAVGAVLESPDCHTRPVEGRVPPQIAGGAMGQLFGRLLRQSDGPAHTALKPAMVAAVRGVEFSEASLVADARADILVAEVGGLNSAAAVDRFLFALPVQVLMELLGVPAARFGEMTEWLGDYGAATAAVITGIPEPTPALIARGHEGAAAILTVMEDLDADRAAAGPLFRAVMEGAPGLDPADLRANAAGLLAQGFASVSGVAGLTLLRLARDEALEARVRADRNALRPLIAEILRADSGTHSTLRFMARDATIAGQFLRRGERIIVLLAAASLDPQLNPEPERFDIDRADPKTFEFGRGVHACPADRLAPRLAEIAVGRVLDARFSLDQLERALSYGASAHIRTPRFI